MSLRKKDEVTKPQDESSTSQADNSDGEQAPETEVGSPENETNALARKGDSKRHRPTWMKKLDLRKVKKSPTSTEACSERPSTSQQQQQQHLQVAVEEGAVVARPGPKFNFRERLATCNFAEDELDASETTQSPKDPLNDGVSNDTPTKEEAQDECNESEGELLDAGLFPERERVTAVELLKKYGKDDDGFASSTDFSSYVGFRTNVIRFANEVASYIDERFVLSFETSHAVLPHDKVSMMLDVIGTDPVAKLKSYAFAVLPADNKMHSVLLDFTGQLRMSELSNFCPLPPAGGKLIPQITVDEANKLETDDVQELRDWNRRMTLESELLMSHCTLNDKDFDPDGCTAKFPARFEPKSARDERKVCAVNGEEDEEKKSLNGEQLVGPVETALVTSCGHSVKRVEAGPLKSAEVNSAVEIEASSELSGKELQLNVPIFDKENSSLKAELANLTEVVRRLNADLEVWKNKCYETVLNNQVLAARLEAEVPRGKSKRTELLRKQIQELVVELEIRKQETADYRETLNTELLDKVELMKQFEEEKSNMKTDYQNLEAELKAYVDRHELNVDIVGKLQQQIISLEAEQKQLNEELVGNSKTKLVKEYYLQIEALTEQEDCLQLQLEEQEYEIERLRNIAHSPSAGGERDHYELGSTQLKGHLHEEELARYRIMSYQPLKGDTFSGAGSYGSVHRVRVNNMPCIAKRILDILVGREREEAVSDKQKQAIQLKFQQECFLLSRMRHPNIVQFMGVHYPDQNPLDLTLIMEFLPMDLQNSLQNYVNLPLPIKLSILLDVSYGLLHLHNASIIHRDLSAANVLLTPDMRAKVADLGVSKIIDVNVSKMTKVPGAIAYMSPEALADTPRYSIELDVFSFGVLALFVANQVFPKYSWALPSPEAMEGKSTEIHRRKMWIDMMGVEHCLYPVVIQCLQDEAGRRPTTEHLNVTLKQLSQDHPRQCTDIVHLEEELARMKLRIATLEDESKSGGKHTFKELLPGSEEKLRQSELANTPTTPPSLPPLSHTARVSPRMRSTHPNTSRKRQAHSQTQDDSTLSGYQTHPTMYREEPNQMHNRMDPENDDKAGVVCKLQRRPMTERARRRVIDRRVVYQQTSTVEPLEADRNQSEQDISQFSQSVFDLRVEHPAVYRQMQLARRREGGSGLGESSGSSQQREGSLVCPLCGQHFKQGEREELRWHVNNNCR